jgi:hypothetical protein
MLLNTRLIAMTGMLLFLQTMPITIRGVAGSKTMCNQRASVRGMGGASGPKRVRGWPWKGDQGAKPPGRPAFLAIREGNSCS